MIRILAALALCSSTALADTWSDDFKAGWCEGYAQAVKSLDQNRDHWRRLVGAPKMSHDEVIKWIYARPWVDGATLRTAPRTLGSPPGTPQVGPPVVESVDLYLVLPQLHGPLQVQDASGWHSLNCNPLTQ